MAEPNLIYSDFRCYRVYPAQPYSDKGHELFSDCTHLNQDVTCYNWSLYSVVVKGRPI